MTRTGQFYGSKTAIKFVCEWLSYESNLNKASNSVNCPVYHYFDTDSLDSHDEVIPDTQRNRPEKEIKDAHRFKPTLTRKNLEILQNYDEFTD